MEDKVIIKVISHGEKKYLTDVQQSSYRMKSSKKPFADPDILKFDIDTAIGIVSQSKFKGFDMKVQIIDINGNNVYNSVDSVINEEVQKFINEGYTMEHENFKFRQEIKNSYFYNYSAFSNDFDVDITESDIFVNWNIAFWLNDSGVENFIINVDSVEGIYKVVLLNKQSDAVEQDNNKNIAEFQWKFIVEDASLQLNKTLYISGLEFDFKSKNCKVTFNEKNNK